MLGEKGETLGEREDALDDAGWTLDEKREVLGATGWMLDEKRRVLGEAGRVLEMGKWAEGMGFGMDLDNFDGFSPRGAAYW